MMKEGTLVDATIIEAPPSTKNAEKRRDPDMHQTKKGNEWHFGMKAHIGVDADSGLVHSVVGTSANVSDVSQAHALLHGHDRVWPSPLAGASPATSRDPVSDRPMCVSISSTHYFMTITILSESLVCAQFSLP